MLLNIESSILKSRKLILVGYDIKYGLQVLRHLEFNETSVINILDSQQIACNILSTEPRTLDNLLDEFKYPQTNLHCAGNDAHFTLRLLLLLVIHSKQGETKYSDRLTTLKEIAYFPVPHRMNPHTKAAKKREKKKE
jgi:DNA polymerase III epsilon subunit-like protein